jgi:hypothetical protein
MAALLIVLAALALVAVIEAVIYRFGRDSRDGDDWLQHKGYRSEVHAR